MAKHETCTSRSASADGSPGRRQGQGAVLGTLERGGRVRTTSRPEPKEERSYAGEVTKHVEAGIPALHRSALSYDGLEGRYAHQVIDHAVQYVDGSSHERMENYWSLAEAGSSTERTSASNRSTCFGISTNRRSASTIGRT